MIHFKIDYEWLLLEFKTKINVIPKTRSFLIIKSLIEIKYDCQISNSELAKIMKILSELDEEIKYLYYKKSDADDVVIGFKGCDFIDEPAFCPTIPYIPLKRVFTDSFNLNSKIILEHSTAIRKYINNT
jgi:hypothetical protein